MQCPMRRLIHIIIYSLILLSACDRGGQTPADRLQPGDLLFQAEAGTDFTDAIATATGRDSVSYTHVGIYVVADGRPCVVEAIPSRGVTLTPLDTFLVQSAAVQAMRLELADVAEASDLQRRAAQEAMKMLGRPYDGVFAAGDSAIYCSELVQIAYRRAARREIFPSTPMNFLAPDSTMPQYWIDHFREAGLPIPQGQPGTNPTALSASAALHPLSVDFSGNSD